MRTRVPETLLEKLRDMPWLLLGVTGLLATLGVLMQYSAAGGAMQPYASAHILRIVVAGLLALAVALTPLTWLVRSAYPVYVLGIALLLYVEASGLMGGGAQRWLDVGPLTIQPSEFMKIGLVLALARYYHYLHNDDVHAAHFMLIPALMIALPALLILRQPNLGTTAILVGIAVVMLFVARLSWKLFAAGMVSLGAAVPLIWQFLHDYQKQRILTFLDPGKDPLGAGYNVAQSIIAVGSGGGLGKGFVQGSQGQLNFLPEKHTDFIFTMLAEELGFAGALLLLLLYGLLLLFIWMLVVRSRNRFGALVCAGVAMLLFSHIFINIAMVMGVVPVVGVPLPFLSYGGSFLLVTILAIGLVLNAYLHRDVQAIRLTRF